MPVNISRLKRHRPLSKCKSSFAPATFRLPAWHRGALRGSHGDELEESMLRNRPGEQDEEEDSVSEPHPRASDCLDKVGT